MAVVAIEEEDLVPERPQLRLVSAPEDAPRMSESALAFWESAARGAATPAPEPQPVSDELLRVMTLLAQALALRFMLLLAVLGAFVLACWAMVGGPTWPELLAVALWAGISIAPLAWLCARGVT